MTNPFDALNSAPTQVAPAAPAPQAFAQPAAPAPQAFVPAQPAPQAFAQPVAAPQAYAQPAPSAVPADYTPVVASVDAINPAQAGIDAFGSGSGGEKHSLRTDMGKALLIRIHGTKMMPGRPGEQPYEVVECDWIVLDPAAPALREHALISNRRVVNDLKSTLNSNKRFHVGRVTEVQSKHPVPAIDLAPLTDQEKEYALQAGQAMGWFPKPAA